MKKSPRLTLLIFLTLTTPAIASTIYLKDGSQIKGSVYSSDKDSVMVETPDGKLTIKRDRIESMDLTEDVPSIPPVSPKSSNGLRKPPPAYSSSASPRTTTAKMMFIGGFDIYGEGGIKDKFEEDTNYVVSALNGVGIRASGSTEVDPGYGFRIGILVPQPGDLELGGSLGLVIGPKITQTLDNGPFVYLPTGQVFNYNGRTEVTTETLYGRLLFEVGKKIPLTQTTFLRLGAAGGFATASIEQNATTSGSAAIFGSNKATDNWTGLTWEISPSLVIPFGTAEAELGLRYTQFPKKDANTEINEIRWSPFSVFLGVRFET